MADNDLAHLRRVVQDAVAALRMQTRDLESALLLRHGTLQLFIDGRLDLRVRHLRSLARLLRVPPADFLELGCPESARAAEHRLTDWIGGGPLRQKAKPAESALPQTAEELQAMIQKAVTDALAAGAAKASAATGDAKSG